MLTVTTDIFKQVTFGAELGVCFFVLLHVLGNGAGKASHVFVSIDALRWDMYM